MSVDPQSPVFWRILTGALLTALLTVTTFLLTKIYDDIDMIEDQMIEIGKTQSAVLRRLISLENYSHAVDDGDRWRATEEQQFQLRYQSEKDDLIRRMEKLEYINERFGRY